MKYDVIIVGAGPSGAFTAYEMITKNRDTKILMIEKGKSIKNRICPKRTTKECVHCKPSCRITTGFAGAGAYSDGKLSLSPDVGGILPEVVGYDKAKELINYADGVYLSLGADSTVYGVGVQEEVEKIRKKAIKNNLKLIDCPIRHLGTEEGYRIYGELEKYLIDNGVDIIFDSMVSDLIVEDNTVKGVKISSRSNSEILKKIDDQPLDLHGYVEFGVEYKEAYADKVVVAVGREGSHWLKGKCSEHNIKTTVGTVDVGVRVEVRDEVMKELNEHLYESKLVYYTKTFDDKVRVFCSNPSGEVATEYYANDLAVVNGHAYKSKDMKTNNTNFALLVSLNFTEPFKSPIEYGEHIAQLGNMLSGNKILVQRYGDLTRGRRTTEDRLFRNNITPTLKDAVPGDLSLVLPYRVMKDLIEMIEALDGVVPGMASDETLLYGIEVKFYSNKVVIDNKTFETSINNLYAIGDGAGITRGLSQASAMGVELGRILLNTLR